MASGKVVILSGPSGVGKDTVIDAWRARDPRVRRVVAYTTRPIRPGETPEVDYHFVSIERFSAMAAAGEFLESKEVHGNHYGTPRRDLEHMVDDGLIAVLKIDVQGALAAMELLPDAVSVFILPPGTEELERRIRGRNTDSPEAITKRLTNAHAEIAHADRYQHQLVNEDVNRVVEQLAKLTMLD